MAFQDYVKQKYGSQNKTGTGSTGSSGNAQNFSSYVSNKYGSKSSTKTAQERLEEARNKIAQRNQAAKNRQNTSSNTKQNSVWDDGNNGNSTGNPGAWWESSYQRKDTTSQQENKNYLKDAASLYDKLKTAGAGVASNLSSIGQKAGTGLKAAAQAAAAAGKTTPAASTTKTNIKNHASDVATRKNPNLIEETLKLGKDLNGRTDTTIANGAANNTVQGLISDDYIPESARDAQTAYMEAKREYEDYIANKGKNNSYPQKPLTEDEQRALQTAETNGLQLGGLKQFDDEWAIQTEATDAAKEKELKAKMDAAAEALETAKKEGAAAAKAKSRDKAIKQYNQLMYTSDFGKNLQNPITKDDQIIIGYQGDSFKSNDAQLIYNMTDRERLIMTYLRNAHGEDAANDYLNILKPDIERRIHADMAERAADAAEKAPITASAVSVIANTADTLMGTAYTGLQTVKKILGLKDSEIDPYSTAYLGGTWRDAARSTVGANLNEWTQEKADNLSNLLGMEDGTINVGNVPNFIYNALMSAADSATSGAIGAATGTTIVGAALQSAGSFVNTVRQSKLQGATDERALGLGVVAGTLEYATEKMGFDRLADIITHPNKSAIRSILSNMMSEYGEEASTDVLNFTAEYIADCLDGTDMSTFNQTYNAYIEQGLDENKALQNTFLDLLGQANESGLAGAISGGVMGGGSVILSKTANAIMQHEFFTGMNAAAEEGDAQAKAYLYNNREGTVDKETYDTAFRVIWDGATNGLTMEQIEESAPDITDALSEAQKQGIYGAAVNATTEEEHTVTQPERSRPTEATADQGEMEAAPAAGEAATTTQPIGTKPTTTFVTDEDVTPEQTADERTTTAQPTVKTTPTAVTADQGDVEQTVNQQAGTTTQPQKTRPKMTRIQIDDEGNRTTSDAEGTSQETGDAQTQQSGAKVSDNISEESAADIKAYITDQTKTNKGGVKASYAQQNLTGEQTRQIRILDELGRHYGVEIEIVDTIANGRANGYYGGGNKIVVALDATDQAYVHVGTHELTHYLKKTNERGYRVLEKTVLDELRKAEPGLAGVYNVDEEVQKRIAAYAEQGIELDEDAALEEIVAEALPAIWSDEKAVRAFVNQNRSLAQKIRDFIVDFVERLKDYTLNYAYDEDYTDSQALRVREQDAAGTLENIARIFDLALESAKGMQQTTAQTTYQTTTNAAGTQLNAASGRTSTQKTASQATTKQAPTAVTADQTNANRTETSRTEANRTNTETRTETAQADEEDTTWESKELKHARVNAMQQEDAVAKAQEKVETLQIRQGINKDQYTELKSILKTDGVAITPLQKKEIIHNYGKYGDYTKMLFGKIKLYESARGWDDRWRDMQNAYPGIFRGDYPEDGIGEALLEVADYLYPNRALEEAQAKLQEEEVRLEEMQDEIKQLEKRDRSATAEERVARDAEFDREEAEDLPFALKNRKGRTKYSPSDGSFNRDTFGLSKSEFAQFYEKIAEIQIEKRPQFQKAPDGSYIFDITNKLVYTDGDWENPQIRRVVSFDLTDGTDLTVAKLFFTEQEAEGLRYERIQTLLSDIFGKTCASVNYGEGRRAIQGQDGRREGQDRSGTGGRNRKDLSSEEKGRKFALKRSVEQIEDLVAAHNTTADKLKRTLDLGGFPMPSIAVTKTGIVHSNFGEITLIFGRETVDPKADKRNKVYSADAWTPTVPSIEYEASAKTQDRINKKLRTLNGKIPEDYRSSLRRYTDVGYMLNNYGGVDGVIENAMNDNAMRAAYVADKGGDVTMEKKTVTEGGVSETQADKYRRTLELFDGDVDKMMRMPLKEIKAMPELSSIWSSMTLNNANRLSFVIGKTADYARGELDARTVEVGDAAATDAKISKQIDETEYKAWLGKLFEGAVGSEGIYNNKERYTASGNQRSFSQLHYPVTVENLVKAMAGQNGGNTKNVSGFFHGAKALRAATAETFKNVDAMHERSGRLQNRTQEEADALTDSLNARLSAIMNDIMGDGKGVDNAFMEHDRIGEQLIEIGESKYTVQSIMDTMAKYRHPVSRELAGRIKTLLDDIREMPVNLFEAKPERVVGFDEIRAAIVPDDLDADLKARLGKITDQVLTYPAGDEAARLKVRDGIEGVKFSLKKNGDAGQEKGRRFALKTESENKVDVERTWRAGNHSLSEQTQSAIQSEMSTEQTQHERVRLVGDLAKWVKKRAGQIVREYKSDANVADVSKDMTSLISELSENGASSAAMNATINMAKGIIEKSRRGENKLREKYKDLCKAMRETKITLSPVQRLEAENLTGSYGRYRQSLFGSVNLTNSGEGTALDIMWQTWSESYPELFTPGLGRKEQVQRLAEIKTMLEPYYQNVYGENLDAAATDLGMRIYAEALEQIGEKGQAQATTTMLEDMRKRYKHLTDDAMNKLKQEQLERFQQIANDLHAAREAGDRALQDEIMKVYRATVKQAGFKEAEAEARSAYRAQFEDAAAWRKAHERTIKYARNLRQELAKPTKQKHVPAGLEAPVLEVLNCIDMSTTGRETQGTRQWKKSLENITQWLDEQARLQQNALDENQSTTDGHEGVWMAICGRTMQDLRTSIGIVKATSGKITEMSLPEMNALSNAMAIINHSINSINETWTLSRNESIRELGDKCVNELKEKRTNRAQESKIPLVRELDNLLNVDQLDAVSFFERLGSVGETVAESLTQGQSKAYERIREAADRAEEIFAIEGARDERDRQKTIRGWRTEEHTFKLTRGTEVEDVTMSGTQLMELYALSKREQALKHILTGGIRIATLDNKKGSVYNYQLTQDQLNAMLSELTADQKACVDRMQGYLSGDVAEWGNEVTMKMYLYKAFGEKNYWPIHSDNDYLRTKEQDGSLMYNALLNASWTKATVDKPKNPITIGDAIETFSGHVSDMATYSGLAMPVDDLLKWYNYQSRDENGNADFNGSIKKEIRRTIGSAGTQYIQRLMDDLNGMGRQAYENGLVGGMIGNYKRAAIMAKIRVVIQQPTAILRAGAMIDPKYIAMARPGKGVISEMQEHSGLAWWKSNGNYEIGTGASMKSIITGMQDSTYEDVTEKLGAPAGMADDIGWATIWQAVKRETEAQNPDTEVGSDEYWKKVRERFEDVCIRTQVVDTVLTRSQLMRSKSQLMKSLTAFMSEPTKNFNLVRNGLSAVYNAKTPEARKAAIKTLVRSTAAITAAQMLNAVVTAGHDMLKYYDPDDEDDDSRLEMFVDNWLSDMADGLNPLGNIPIIKDVYAMVTGDDVERMDLSAISAAVSAVEKAGNYISGNSKGLTFYGAFKPLATALGNLVGAPASGLIADAELIVNIISPGALRTTQRDSSTGDAYTMIYEAIASGDTKKADKLRTKLKSGAYGNTPKSDKEIDAGVRDILAAEDDRIRQCYELKQQGSSTKQLVALEKEIMADGFTQEQVVGAVNRYPAIVGKTIKDSYKAAYALGETEKMEQYAKQAKSLGYGDADIEGWVATKDLDEQLTGGEMYSSEDMMTYIRNGTEGDIEDVVNYRISVNGGANAEQSVHNSIAGEFKGEYTDLVTSGQTGKAADLKERLLTAGLTEKTIDGWVYTNDVLASWLIDGEGTMQDAQDVLEYKVKYSTAQNPEESGTNALKSYRDEYIELVETDKKKAKAMRERLIELGLSESLIEKWDAAAKEE